MFHVMLTATWYHEDGHSAVIIIILTMIMIFSLSILSCVILSYLTQPTLADGSLAGNFYFYIWSTYNFYTNIMHTCSSLFSSESKLASLYIMLCNHHILCGFYLYLTKLAWVLYSYFQQSFSSFLSIYF